jgi:solute carrier family 25 (mitochondrial carnitine/acylcarnitine transporter), member 20/29
LVKVRQQTATGKDKAAITKKGTMATLGDIIATEGFSGMYRGVSAPMVAVAPIWAMSFWGFDTGDKLVRLVCNNLSPEASLNIWQLCIAGGFSALPTVLVMVPCERVKCLLQIQKQKDGAVSNAVRTTKGSSPRRTTAYKGFADCVAGIYQQAGLAGLYKGTALTLMRDIPGNMVYFGVYTLAHEYFGTSPAAALLAGALAGLSFWPIVLPMDTLKSRYQTAPDGTYANIGQVYSQLVQEEGVGGLFRGIGPAMMRSAPANAVSFLGAELTKSALAKFT